MAILLTVVDSTLSDYPAYLGVAMRQLQAQALLNQPLIRSALDITTSPLLQPSPSETDPDLQKPLDSSLPSVFSTAAGSLPLASVSSTLRSKFNGRYVRSDFIFMSVGGANDTQLPLNIAQAAGAPGTFSYVVYSQVCVTAFLDEAEQSCKLFNRPLQGIISSPWTPVNCVDSLSNAVLISQDYGTGSCPSDVPIYDVTQGATIMYTPTSASDNTVCPNACSTVGTCVCGVCVCPPGADGAADCSLSFQGDAFAQTFGTDSFQYKSRWGGMVVFDFGAVWNELQSEFDPLTDAPLAFPKEAFPRFIFPAILTVGAVPNTTALNKVIAKYGSSAVAVGAGLVALSDLSTRIEDLAGWALTKATSISRGAAAFGTHLRDANVTFRAAVGNSYRVSPVVVDCSGNAYPQVRCVISLRCRFLAIVCFAFSLSTRHIFLTRAQSWIAVLGLQFRLHPLQLLNKTASRVLTHLNHFYMQVRSQL